MLERNH